MGDEALTTAIATVVSALIAGLVAYATQRSARKTAAANTEASRQNTRADVEKEAYLRAEQINKGIIDRQDAEIDELREDQGRDREQIKSLTNRVQLLEKERAADHKAIRDLREELEYQVEKNRVLERRLLKPE